MTQNLDEILALLGGVNDLMAKSPRGAEVLERVRTGKISVDAAVLELIEISKEEGTFKELQRATSEVAVRLPGVTDPTAGRSVDRPLVMETSTGLRQLNPLFEAAIAERASLDGDVPELRHGPLPRDATPAIPIVTNLMDPIAIGLMLEKASTEVKARLDLAMEEHAQLQDSIISIATQTAQEAGTNVALAVEAAEKLLPMAPTGVPGYRAGEVPAPMVVEPPSMAEMEMLSPTDRRTYSYKALATTQGRTSFSGPIQQVVLKVLRDRGLIVEIGSPSPAAFIFSTVWSVNVWGPEDLSESVNYAQMAAKSIANDLAVKAAAFPLILNKTLVLEVFPYNGIADRRFGWVGRLGHRRE